MMMTDERNEELFRAMIESARRQAPAPGDDLFDRVMADADREIASRARAVVRCRPRRSAASVLLAVLGGWGAVGSMTVAALVGLWVGVFPPDGLAALSPALLGGETVAVPLTGADALTGLEDML
ncbi:MAG: hypothetical protein GVY31_11215 [Alphaproteobacteria bacterium]|jgi:negative regulator of sigma E activity|nr:hypothetical protein [Alphaproteobacteria bacterium]